MSATHQNLLNMYAAATTAGQSPVYHVSPLLATILSHVAQSGQLPGLSPSPPWAFLAVIDNIGIQLNPFNPAKVCVVNSAEWDGLSDEQRQMIFQIFECVSSTTMPHVQVLANMFPGRFFRSNV